MAFKKPIYYLFKQFAHGRWSSSLQGLNLEYNPQLDICFPKVATEDKNIQYILNSLQDMTVYEYNPYS